MCNILQCQVYDIGHVTFSHQRLSLQVDGSCFSDIILVSTSVLRYLNYRGFGNAEKQAIYDHKRRQLFKVVFNTCTLSGRQTRLYMCLRLASSAHKCCLRKASRGSSSEFVEATPCIWGGKCSGLSAECGRTPQDSACQKFIRQAFLGAA